MVSEINSTQKVYEIYDLLRRADGVYSLIGKDVQEVAEKDVKLLVFYYPQKELFDSVFTRTSYIAKTRKDKETRQHLLDVVALTQDDSDIFNPFLKDASRKVFEKLQAFTREVNGAYAYLLPSGIPAFDSGKTYTKGAIIEVGGEVWELTGADSSVSTGGFDSTNWTQRGDYELTDDKIIFTLLNKDWFNSNMLSPLDSSIFEAMVSYVMFRWFTIVFPEEAEFYLADFERFGQDVVINSNANNRPLVRRHRMF